MADRVVVRVPATVANLGPGFDCVGVAIAWHNEIRFERAAALSVTADGPGAERVAKDESNLVLRAVGALLGEIPPMRVHEAIRIPSGRGFGSSASAIVAGLVGARALAGTGHTDADLLSIATELEGHADNVAPCMLGGVTVSAGGRSIRLDAPLDVQPLLCVAPGELPTEVARAALPETLARADAIASLGRAALLVAALATGTTDALMDATVDSFHQPPRFALMPDSGRLVEGLRARGVPAFLSGAGPSVTALVPVARAEEARDAARELVPSGWDLRLAGFDARGAEVIETS